jgi:hypothetical protein
VSSVPRDSIPSDRASFPGFGWGAATLQRYLGTIGVILGFVVLGVFAVFAMSPGLLCRWTGYDCAAAPKAIFAPSHTASGQRPSDGESANVRKPAPATRQNIEAPAPLVRGEQADGHYLARSQAACGEKPTSVIVDIKSAAIAWRYEYGGIVYQWRGEIDADGAIRASVGGSDAFKASGRFTDAGREATMIYPDCPDGIAMRIVNKIPD